MIIQKDSGISLERGPNDDSLKLDNSVVDGLFMSFLAQVIPPPEPHQAAFMSLPRQTSLSADPKDLQDQFNLEIPNISNLDIGVEPVVEPKMQYPFQTSLANQMIDTMESGTEINQEPTKQTIGMERLIDVKQSMQNIEPDPLISAEVDEKIPSNSLPDLLSNEAQPMSMKKKPLDNAKSQPLITKEYAASVPFDNKLSPLDQVHPLDEQMLKEQVSETPILKTDLKSEQVEANSFKHILDQTSLKPNQAITPTESSKEIKPTPSYEIHYEPSQANEPALGHKASLRIHQEGLGQINVTIDMKESSKVTLVTESTEAMQTIKNHLPELKHFFSEANLILDQVNIEHQSKQDKPSQQHHVARLSGDDAEEIKVIDELIPKAKTHSLIDTYV